MKQSIETERKFLIAMPAWEDVEKNASVIYDITQIYLKSPLGITHRIRSLKSGNCEKYFETLKKRIDKFSSYEDEKEITEEEFARKSQGISEDSRPIVKKRACIQLDKRVFEIDIYPEWKNQAVMEIELQDPNEALAFPDFIKIIREVSGDKEYTNASLARRFPSE